MNPLIQCKTTILPLLLAGVLVSFAISPMAQAVVPAPDGGYPGGNTAEGQNALLSLTTGGFNTAAGWLSLRNLTTGSFNTAIGAGTLSANTADQNTATGTGALLLNTSGFRNTANGALALLNNTEGNFNTATGVQALFHNTIGNYNTASGVVALFANTEGSSNTAVGTGALFINSTGDENTAIGNDALTLNTGSFNTAVGTNALYNNTTGNNNTAVGRSALFTTTSGDNTAVGASALTNNTSGNHNTALGDGAGLNVTTANNVICIGALLAGQNVSDSCYIGNIFGQTSASGAAVYVNSNHRLGTLTSSSRFKNNIKPMEQLSEALFALKPVTFRYKKEIDPAGMQQFGLVAEEVEKVKPDLVVRDNEGKPYSVRYDQVNAMLLNEFLKEHKQVETQQANIEQLKSNAAKQAANISSLKKEIEVLTVQLKTQGAQIQKVMAQQMKKITPHTVAER